MSSNPSLPPPLPPAVLPYASPAAYQPAPTAGVWQDGNVIVAFNGAVFPPRCVKCNAQAEPARALRKEYYWHHPAIFFTVLAGVLLYAILAVVIRKKGTVTFCLCDLHRAKRRNGILLGWILIPGGIALMIASAVYQNGWITLVGALVFIAGVIAAMRAQPLKPKKIDDHYLWLKGGGPAFLAELPGVVRQ
jgi:hypothetical protein